MITILTEKRDMGEKIAKAVGADNQMKGYYQGNGYYVTWAAGHLLEQYVPGSEGEWSIQKLPILPEEFQLIVRREKSGGKKITGKVYEQRLFVINYLLSRSDSIINAGDPGMEGELIQREILEHTGCKLPVKRLWLSSTSTAGIREGMQNLRPSSDFDTLYAAAKARSEADWLVGINGTMALTCSAESNRILSLGRVQTPVLAMICKRFIERQTFQPEPYWKIRLELTSESGEPFTVSSARFMDQQEAERAAKQALTARTTYIRNYEEKTVKDTPPLLYDLTELMKAAIRRYQLTSEEVEAAAQNLYMGGYISYPRTPSQYITEHEYQQMPELLDGLCQYGPLAEKARALRGKHLNTNCVNELKVTDHFGLIITERIPQNLQGAEKTVYELIAERMIEALSPNCIKERRTVTATVGETEYKASASLILEPGWRTVRGVGLTEEESKQIRKEENGDTDEDIVMNIPALRQGSSLPIEKVTTKQGMTTPPNLYTEDTLLSAMKNTGAKPDQNAQQKGLQKGLGTPATRHDIIKTLKTREYVHITGNKKQFEPTELGMTVYKIVKDKGIADAEMTAQWEEALENIIDGRIRAADFDKSIRMFAAQLTEQLIMENHKADIMNAFSKEVITCPECGKKNYTSQKGYFCKYCDFQIYRTIASKKLTDTQLKNLIEIGITQEISGFKKKDGTTFSAALRRDGKKIYFGKK